MLVVWMKKMAAFALGAGLVAAAWVPLSAQANPYKDKAVPMDQATRCPPRWERGNGNFDTSPLLCYPQYANSPQIYRNRSKDCRAGYGNFVEQWCVEGYDEHPQLANPNVMAKAHRADRCPAGFYTYMDKCTTELANPPKARVKGNAACRAGEIAEWGIWCTSGYEHLSVQDIRSAHYRDWNYIYSMTRGGNPRQGPSDEDASEVYKAMFGDDRLDGPVGKANAALVNKRPLTAEQRQLLANANAATAAMLPPEGTAAAGSDGDAASGSSTQEKPECQQIKLRGKLGQLARKAVGC